MIPDPKLLGQILLLQSALHTVDEPARIYEMIAHCFSRFPGVLRVGYQIDEDPMPPDGSIEGQILQLPLKTASSLYGQLFLYLQDQAAAAPYQPFFHNTANLAALILEARQRERQLRRLTKSLDATIKQRTEALEQANQDLQHEVASRIHAEEVLKKSTEGIKTAHRQIEAILHSVPHPLLVLNNCLHVILMNRAAEDLLGLAHGSRGLPALHKLLPSLQINMDDLQRNRQIKLDVFELVDQQRGETRLFDAVLSPVNPFHGQGEGLVLQLQDVTHERHLSQMKDEFISTAAHELNTPLTAMMGYLELLLNPDMVRSVPREEQSGFLQTVYDKAQLLSHLVDELLNVSRIESGAPLPLNRSQGQFAPMLHELVRHYQAKTADHRVTLELEAGADRLSVDREKMEQVFHNLLSNAVKYSPEGGEIAIQGRSQADGYCLLVEDQGVGMNATQVAKIFDKFYRADASDTAVGGLGLGMTIVKQIVEAHGGTIGVQSDFGRGTLVQLTLPFP